MATTRKRLTPDPLNAHDPRVKIQDVDRLGQTYGPGDLIAIRGYSALEFGKVLRIQALRNDGSPLSRGKTRVHYHWIRRNAKSELVFAYYMRQEWDAKLQCYVGGIVTPVTGSVRYPDLDLIKCDALIGNVKDAPGETT